MPFLSVLAPWNIIFVFFVAQYYELNARENSWCEILEFWAFLLICLIYSGLCGLWTNAYSDSEPAMFLFCCKCSPFALQRESFCTANVVHLQSNGTTFAVQKGYIWRMSLLNEHKKSSKTVSQISIMRFWFVTLFYCLSYICVGISCFSPTHVFIPFFPVVGCRHYDKPTAESYMCLWSTCRSSVATRSRWRSSPRQCSGRVVRAAYRLPCAVADWG